MKATLVFPIENDRTLLALKKKKVGAGKWNGYGGKQEPGETIRAAAVRELFEESGGIRTTEEDLRLRGRMDFYFFDNKTAEPNWSVVIYTTSTFSGEAIDTPEAGKPTWFFYDQIPYDNMLPADRDFLPKALSDEKPFLGKVVFTEGMAEVASIEYFEADENTLE